MTNTPYLVTSPDSIDTVFDFDGIPCQPATWTASLTNQPKNAFRLGLPRPQGRLDNARLTRVLAYIENHLAEAMTVTDLAKVACLSVFHFTRAFAAAMDVPPHRYVKRRQIESAKELIATGQTSLSEIAFDCRFSSQSSFTRAFKRATGITPAEYRRRLRIEPMGLRDRVPRPGLWPAI